MRYLSVCSGIEAATVAWHGLGWTPVGFSEIEPFPSAVLAHHYPNVPNFGDMTKHEQWPLQPGSIDLLVGGTPCQSFSVAGLRKGLHDPRGGLMLTYLEIARRLRPRWVVWENVPGVLSSNGGRDFGSFLGAMGLLGYGVAYRVLDAQWVRTHGHPRAVPQRRRRVFVVGCLGDWTRAAQVLFERESVQRDSSSRRAKGQGVASDVEGGVGTDIHETVGALCADTHPGAYSGQDAYTGRLIPQPIGYRWQNNRDGLQQDDAVAALCASSGNSGFHEMNHPVVAVGFNWQNGGGYGNANEGLGITVESTGPLQRCNTPAVATSFIPGNSAAARSMGETEECCVTIKGDGGGSKPHVQYAMTVRRLTPRECERLQGFPDDYTLIPWRKKQAEDCPDGPRYKALGNSMAVNCMAWIGERIAAVDAERNKT